MVTFQEGERPLHVLVFATAQKVISQPTHRNLLNFTVVD